MTFFGKDISVLPAYLCDPCAVPYVGKVRHVALVKIGYTFADITNPVEWDTAQIDGNVMVLNHVWGSFNGGSPVNVAGYGAHATQSFFTNFELTINDSNYFANCDFYNKLRGVYYYRLVFVTETHVWETFAQVRATVSVPVPESDTDPIVAQTTFFWTDKVIPCPSERPIGVFESCLTEGGNYFQNALFFDGVNDSVESFGEPFDWITTENFTIMAWVRVNTAGVVNNAYNFLNKRKFNGIVSIAGFSLLITGPADGANANRLRFECYNEISSVSGGLGQIRSTNVFTSQVWHQVVVQRTGLDATLWKMWIDAVPQGFTTLFNTMTSTNIAGAGSVSGDLRMGRILTNTGSFFSAVTLDEIIVQKSLISQAEITHRYNGGLGASPLDQTGIIGYWNMNQPAGSPTLLGSSIPPYHGTLSMYDPLAQSFIPHV